MTKQIKKYLSLLLAFVFVLSVAGPVLAANTGQEPPVYSVTLHKLDYRNDPKPEIQNTGQVINLDGLQVKAWNNNELGQVGFTVYKLDEAKVKEANLNNNNPQTIANEVETAVKENISPLPYGAIKVNQEVMVDNEGKAKFSLQEGQYVFVETTKSNTVVKDQHASPLFVSIPLTNPSGTGYLDEVNLYPKNKVEVPVQELTKLVYRNDSQSPIVYEGAKFDLYSGTPGSPDARKINGANLVTSADGKISVTNLTVGSYYFVENSVADPDLVQDSHNKVLIKPEFTNSNSNKLTFEYKNDGTIVYPNDSLLADGQQVVNYETPSLAKEVTDVKDKGFAVGQEINYKLTISTPHDVNTYTELILTDKAPQGLTINPASIMVKDKTPGTHYTLITNPGPGEDFTYKIVFTPSGLTNHEILEVSYTAKINDLAEIGQAQENTATLKFNNGLESGSVTDKEEVKTYGHNILKKGDGLFSTGIGKSELKDAKFVIQDANGSYLLKAENSVTWVNDENMATIFTTNENGLIELKGLQLGKYKAIEKTAPAGYQLPTNPVTEFEIIEHEANTPLSTEITNYRSPELPMTGSEKVVLVVGGLAVLLVLALVLGKKSKKDVVK